MVGTDTAVTLFRTPLLDLHFPGARDADEAGTSRAPFYASLPPPLAPALSADASAAACPLKSIRRICRSQGNPEARADKRGGAKMRHTRTPGAAQARERPRRTVQKCSTTKHDSPTPHARNPRQVKPRKDEHKGRYYRNPHEPDICCHTFWRCGISRFTDPREKELLGHGLLCHKSPNRPTLRKCHMSRA